MSSLNLHQSNHFSNFYDNILDLCFSNCDGNISLVIDEFISPDLAHPVLDISVLLPALNLSCDNNAAIHYDYYKLDFKTANYTVINAKLSEVDWNNELSSLSAIDAIDKFYSIVLTILDNEIPKKHFKLSTFPNWFSSSLISLILRKKESHKRYKESLELNDFIKVNYFFSEFLKLRKLCKNEMKNCYSNYIHYVENSLDNQVKKFWDFIRSKNNTNGYPCRMHLDNIFASDSSSIANLFKTFFSSVYLHENCVNEPVIDDFSSDSLLHSIDISLDDILQSISKAKLSYSPGTDGIPSSFLKNTSQSIIYPLHILFCKSIREGKSHIMWKNSTITPIFKSGDRTDIKNYRPITNINTIPSLLDNIIANKLVKYCSDKISSKQHGFIMGRSTVSNLAIHTHSIVDAISKHLQYDSIYTDFKKAFDLVNHSILINKLIKFQVPLNIIKWIKDYLNDRYTSIKIHNCLSEAFRIPCGVPQGSHIGPILFVIFINDLVNEVDFSNCLLFADDCKISCLINSIDDCIKLQRDLNKLFAWCIRNGMLINIDKCNVISFSRSHNLIIYDYKIDNQSLTRVSLIKDLGVTFDSRLTFTPHLDNIINRANRNWFFICRHTKEFKNPKSIKILYFSLVRSILTYACTIWRPIFKFDMLRLERVQHRALRKITFLDDAPMHRFSHDYTAVSSKFNIPSITSLFDSIDSIYVYKTMSNSKNLNPLKSLLPLNTASYPTRFHLPFRAPIPRNAFSTKDPIYRLCKLGNNIKLHKSFHTDWNISNTVATNLINTFILDYS